MRSSQYTQTEPEASSSQHSNNSNGSTQQNSSETQSPSSSSVPIVRHYGQRDMRTQARLELERFRSLDPMLIARAMHDRFLATIRNYTVFPGISRRTQQRTALSRSSSDRRSVLTLIRDNSPALRTLSLTSADAQHMAALSQALTHNTNLVELSITSVVLDKGMIRILAQHHAFRVLRLIQCQVDNDDAIFFAKHCKIPVLDFSDNTITSLGAIAFADNPHIITLSLAHNAVCDRGAKALALSTSIRSLDVSWNLITEDGAEAFAHGGRDSILISLNLANNSVGNNGAMYLSDSSSITSLNLSNNGLDDECTKKWGENKKINTLVLDKNHIGPEGAKQLSNSKSLTRLSLDQNDLGDSGAAYLGQSYRGYWLSVGLNGITNEGAKILARSETITTLLAEGNLIGNEGGVSLANNTKITTLGLSGNRLGNVTMCALVKNNTLTSLNIDSEHLLEPDDYILWSLLVASQDHRSISEWTLWVWKLEHYFNEVGEHYHSMVKEKIRQNQERARRLVLICRDNDLTKNEKYRRAMTLLESATVKVLPYGQYIESQLNYGDTLLHMAVRDENIPLIILLKNHMPAHECMKRDAFNMTYEELALFSGLDLPARAKFTETNEEATPAHTINTQLESGFIEQNPQVREYYKELKENLLMLKMASHLITRTGIVCNASLTAQGLSAVAGGLSKTLASIIAWLGNQIETQKRNSLAEWLDDDNTVIILARRLAYAKQADILAYSPQQEAIDQQLGIFANKPRDERQYTSAKKLGCIDSEKIATYLRDNQKPAGQPVAETVELLLKVMMGNTFEYKTPPPTPVIDKGKTPVRQAAPQNVILPPVPVAQSDNEIIKAQRKQLAEYQRTQEENEKKYQDLDLTHKDVVKKCDHMEKEYGQKIKERDIELRWLNSQNIVLNGINQILDDEIRILKGKDKNQQNDMNQEAGSSSSSVQEDSGVTGHQEAVTPTLAPDSAAILTVFFSFNDHRIVNNSQHPQPLPLTREIREQRIPKSRSNTLTGGFY